MGKESRTVIYDEIGNEYPLSDVPPEEIRCVVAMIMSGGLDFAVGPEGSSYEEIKEEEMKTRGKIELLKIGKQKGNKLRC